MALAVTLPEIIFSFPTLFAGGQLATTQLSNLLPVLPVLFWIWGIDRSRDEFQKTAVRHDQLSVLDIAVPLILVVASALLAGFSEAPAAVVLNRNLVGLFGLALLSINLALSRYGFLIPVGYLIAAMLAGYQQFQIGPSHWASVLLTTPDLAVTFWAYVVFGLGLAVYSASTLWQSVRH